MDAFKEEAYIFEKIAKKQSQIYTDACDYGYAYNTNNVPNEIQQLINAVNSFKEIDKKSPNKKTFSRENFIWDNGVEVKIRIAWEMDEGFFCGTEYKISYCKILNQSSLIQKNCNAYISVYMNNYKESVTK